MKNRNLILGLMFFLPKLSYASVPSCVLNQPNVSDSYCNTTYSDPDQYESCKLRVRAKEYALRTWYSDAIAKAQNAHLLDYSNTEAYQQLICYQQSFADVLNTKSLADIQIQYPELALTTTDEQIRYRNSLVSSVSQIKQYTKFSSFLGKLTDTTWSVRLPKGQAAYASITYGSLPAFVQFLQFNTTDILEAAKLITADSSVSIACSIYYPLQFGFSTQSIMSLISSSLTFMTCRNDAYRAILIQAFTANGIPSGSPGEPNPPPTLQDSSYTVIGYTGEGADIGGGVFDHMTLDYPDVVLAAKVTDVKMAKAIIDSLYIKRQMNQQSDILQADLDALTTDLNAFLNQLGIENDTKKSFFKSLVSYSLGYSDLIHLKLAAQLATQVR